MHYTVHAGYRPGERTRIELNANLANIDLVDPGLITRPMADQWYDLRRRGVDLSLAHDSGWGETQLKLHGNFGRNRVFDGFRSNDHTFGVMLYQTGSPWPGAAATLGLDWKKYGGTAENVLQKADFGSHEITEFAPYFHLQQLAFKWLIFSTGVRMENHELFGSVVLPKAGVVVNATSTTALRLSAAKGFRSPTIRELYLFPAPTPDLQPEKMWNYEAGLSQTLGQKLRLEAVLFRSEGSDLVRVQGRYPNLVLVNSGEFLHTGYEISASWLPFAGWEVTAAWSKLDLDDQTMNSPGKKVSLALDVPLKSLRFSLAAQRILDLYGADSHAQPLDDYTLVDASLRWQARTWLSGRLLLKNCFDAEYQTMTGYPMPGRYAILEWTLEL